MGVPGPNGGWGAATGGAGRPGGGAIVGTDDRVCSTAMPTSSPAPTGSSGGAVPPSGPAGGAVA
eukprot:5762748-Alexandrium_andersonii.AAC.1